MIKVIAPAQRHPTNRELADFHHYWGESHGPVYAHTRNLRGYVQHLTLHDAYGRKPAPTYDGSGVDLGRISGPRAADLLLDLAARGGEDGEEIIAAASLADSAVVWPRLLTLARSRSLGGAFSPNWSIS